MLDSHSSKPTKTFHIGRQAVRYRVRPDGFEIWLMGNADCSIGTYLFFDSIYKDVTKITLHEDGGVTEFRLDD